MRFYSDINFSTKSLGLKIPLVQPVHPLLRWSNIHPIRPQSTMRQDMGMGVTMTITNSSERRGNDERIYEDEKGRGSEKSKRGRLKWHDERNGS